MPSTGGRQDRQLDAAHPGRSISAAHPNGKSLLRCNLEAWGGGCGVGRSRPRPARTHEDEYARSVQAGVL